MASITYIYSRHYIIKNLDGNRLQPGLSWAKGRGVEKERKCGGVEGGSE
jgi:hypothetical protein